MKRIDILAAVLHYFASYTKSENCFMTTDAQIFHEKPSADTHQNYLDGDTNKTEVLAFTREEIPAYKAEMAKEEGAGAPNPKDWSKAKKEDLQNELKRRGVEYKGDANKEALLALLKKHQEEFTEVEVTEALLALPENESLKDEVKVGDTIFVPVKAD